MKLQNLSQKSDSSRKRLFRSKMRIHSSAPLLVTNTHGVDALFRPRSFRTILLTSALLLLGCKTSAVESTVLEGVNGNSSIEDINQDQAVSQFVSSIDLAL